MAVLVVRMASSQVARILFKRKKKKEKISVREGFKYM